MCGKANKREKEEEGRLIQGTNTSFGWKDWG
jgi:hypothetical protein